MKRTILTIIAFLCLFALLPNAVKAQSEPNYEIFIKLFNHNIALNDDTFMFTDIVGYGKCDESQLTIQSEIPLIFESFSKNGFSNAHSLSEVDLEESGLVFDNYCLNGVCNPYSYGKVQTNNLDFKLNQSFFSSEETRLKLKLKIEPEENLKYGGDYSINALFFCKLDNTMFIFKDSTQFRVMYDKEDKQYNYALGALFISIFALLSNILRDFILPLIFKPRLSIEAENDDECIEDTISAMLGSQKSRWLRIRIRNDDALFSRKANNCYVKLLSIRDINNKRLVKPFNPFPLPWVLYNNYKNDLAKGEYHLIDLVYEQKSQRCLFINGKDYPLPSILSKRIEDSEEFGPGSYALNIALYGDNFKPVFKTIKVEITDDFGKLRFIK